MTTTLKMFGFDRSTAGPSRKSSEAAAAMGVRFAGVESITPQQWANVKQNPRQRNTEERARRARHLLEPHPAHALVSMARLPDGRCIKLDGHTRDFKWKSGTLTPPPTLFAEVWLCDDIQQVTDLYDTFDSRDAVETGADQLFGAVREQKLNFNSDLLKTGQYISALRDAHKLVFGHGQTAESKLQDIVKRWSPELMLLDECGPSRARFITGVVAGAMVTFRRFGPDATDFWTAFARDAGNKIGDEMDAVHALTVRIDTRKAAKATHGRNNIQDIVAICLSAFDRHRAGGMYSLKASGIKALKATSLKAWLQAARSADRSWATK